MKTKSPLKPLKLNAAFFAVCVGLFGVCGSADGASVAPVLHGRDVRLESHGDLDLFSFDYGVLTDQRQELLGLDGYGNPSPRRGKLEFVVSGAVDPAELEKLEEIVDGSPVNHSDDCLELVGRAFASVTELPFGDHDASLTVEEASEVGEFDFVHLGSVGMVANSVDTRCPAREGAEGQYRTKQEGESLPGVRNDQVQPPKGKVWSDLTGNREKSAEMTGSHELILAHGVTQCYNNKLLQTVRYVDPLRKGDLSFGGLYYNDIPWYWDRQCPTGRIYILNTKYVHFVVDPLMFFRWTETRSWPNQVVDIRLLLLRLALVYKSRMFLTVLDGYTA